MPRRAREAGGALRFALAFLGNEAADRAPFYAFWRAVTGAGDKGINPTLVHMLRHSKADQAARAIYRLHGRDVR